MHTVTLNFATPELKKMFIQWMVDGGGEDAMVTAAEDDEQTIDDFEYSGANKSIITIS